MFGLTALELARIQFAFTMSSHIIFPATTIGLASYLVALEGLWLWKKDTTYRDLYHFWSHIFAVNFAMGVVSGIVMAYQFGTNWSYYSAFAGTITRIAVPARAPASVPGLYWFSDQPVAQNHSTDHIDHGSRRAA